MSVLHDIIDRFIDLVPGLTQGERDVMHELVDGDKQPKVTTNDAPPKTADQDQEGPR